jgi:hypothetical protein
VISKAGDSQARRTTKKEGQKGAESLVKTFSVSRPPVHLPKGSSLELDSAEEPPFFISDRREECFRFKYEGAIDNFDPNSRK